jgi:hypothetical protein
MIKNASVCFPVGDNKSFSQLLVCLSIKALSFSMGFENLDFLIVGSSSHSF